MIEDEEPTMYVDDIRPIGRCAGDGEGHACKRRAAYVAAVSSGDHKGVLFLCYRHAQPMVTHMAEHEHGEWD